MNCILKLLICFAVITSINSQIYSMQQEQNTQPAPLSSKIKSKQLVSRAIEKDGVLVEIYNNNTVRITDILTNKAKEGIIRGKAIEYIENKFHYVLSSNKRFLFKIYGMYGKIKIFDLEKQGKQSKIGHFINIKSYKFSPGKNILVMCSCIQKKEIITIICFENVYNFYSLENRCPNDIPTIEFLCNETCVFINFNYKSIVIINTQKGRTILDIRDNIFNYKFGLDRKLIFVSYNYCTPGGFKNIGAIYDLSCKKRNLDIELIQDYKKIFKLESSLKNNFSDKFILETNYLPRKFSPDSYYYYYNAFRCQFNFNNDSRYAFIYDGNKLIEIIDINNKVSIAKKVNFFKFSLNGKLLFVCNNNKAQIINLENNYKIKQSATNETESFNCKFSDDENFILLFKNSTATLYESKNKKFVLKFENIDFNESMFSSDSRFLHLKYKNNYNKTSSCNNQLSSGEKISPDQRVFERLDDTNKFNSGYYKILNLNNGLFITDNNSPQPYTQNNQELSQELSCKENINSECEKEEIFEEIKDSENALIEDDSYFVNQVLPTDNQAQANDQEPYKEEPFWIEPIEIDPMDDDPDSIDHISSMELEQIESEEMYPEKMKTYY